MKRILVVDDDEDTLFTLKRGLAESGYSVDTEFDPKEVVSNFRAGKYDLVVLDFRMPGINGFELFQKIRKVDSNVKVCFLTAWQHELDANLKSLIVNGHLIIRKPITISELQRKIQQMLN